MATQATSGTGWNLSSYLTVLDLRFSYSTTGAMVKATENLQKKEHTRMLKQPGSIWSRRNGLSKIRLSLLAVRLVVGLLLAARFTPGALILESTFTSLPDIAAARYWFMPIRLLMRIKYNTAERLGDVNCPVLIVHSHDDEEIPFIHGQQLFEFASEPKKFLEITGTHNEGFITSGILYEDGINNFIHQCIDLQ